MGMRVGGALLFSALHACATVPDPALPGVPVAETAPRCVIPQNMVLLISIGELERPPGATDTLQVWMSARPGAFDPLPDACPVGWRLSPGAPATIDPAGVLRIAPGAPDGASFNVAARVANEEVTATVRVVHRALNPLVGVWRQVAELACPLSTGEAAPADPIRELRFFANGTFTVTWLPFEAYVDYGGSFTYDRASGALRLEAERVNYLPPDLDLEGRAQVEGNTLSLLDLWLGSRVPGAGRGCGMRFQRASGG